MLFESSKVVLVANDGNMVQRSDPQGAIYYVLGVVRQITDKFDLKNECKN